MGGQKEKRPYPEFRPVRSELRTRTLYKSNARSCVNITQLARVPATRGSPHRCFSAKRIALLWVRAAILDNPMRYDDLARRQAPVVCSDGLTHNVVVVCTVVRPVVCAPENGSRGHLEFSTQGDYNVSCFHQRPFSHYHAHPPLGRTCLKLKHSPALCKPCACKTMPVSNALPDRAPASEKLPLVSFL